MSRTNIPSNNLPSTETITDSLREIFITKSDKPLSAEEAPEIRGQTMQIVDHEAVKLGSKNPTTFHERVAMYSANQTNSEGYVLELSDGEEVSEDQVQYFQSNLKKGFTGEDVRACHETIKNLKETYQLNALRLGFSNDQARNINPRASNYLVGLHNNHESKESIHATYEKITSLNGHQAESFQRGLDHKKAANITLEQFDATLKQFNAKGKDKIISLPKSGESQESLDCRTFVSCFQLVTRVQAPSIYPNTSQRHTNKRSGDPLINTISAKR